MARLSHPFPAGVVTLASLLAVLLLQSPHVNVAETIRVAVLVGVSQFATGALNDFMDYGQDVISRPDKPLAQGLVPPPVALGGAVLGLVAVLAIALTFGLSSLGVALLGMTAAFSYDLGLKRTASALLSYVAGFSCLLAWLLIITGRFSISDGLAFPASALLISSVYLANNVPDIELDRVPSRRSLPVRLGIRRTVLCSLALGVSGVAPVFAASLALREPFPALLCVAGLALFGAACLSRPFDSRSRSAGLSFFRFMALGVGATGIAIFAVLIDVSNR